jgi:hypothetical protein
MTASLGILVIRSSLVDWRSMKKRVQTCTAHKQPPDFWLPRGFWPFLGMADRYKQQVQCGKGPPIKAEQPEPSLHLGTAFKIYHIYEYLNESSSARPGGSQHLKIPRSLNSKRAASFSSPAGFSSDAGFLPGAGISTPTRILSSACFSVNVGISQSVCFSVNARISQSACFSVSARISQSA